MRLLIDGHLDLAWNALSWGRDITLDLDQLNRDETGMTDHPSRGRATTTLPEMRRAGIAVCQATLLARAKPLSPPAGGTCPYQPGFPQPADRLGHGAWSTGVL